MRPPVRYWSFAFPMVLLRDSLVTTFPLWFLLELRVVLWTWHKFAFCLVNKNWKAAVCLKCKMEKLFHATYLMTQILVVQVTLLIDSSVVWDLKTSISIVWLAARVWLIQPWRLLVVAISNVAWLNSSSLWSLTTIWQLETTTVQLSSFSTETTASMWWTPSILIDSGSLSRTSLVWLPTITLMR